ncbi:MAG TPA: ribose 5-phosphate isomerase B [Anaerolineales bacterium]|nr:ribose 5-phosphate isomerase B [Anaerolineales bacterium]
MNEARGKIIIGADHFGLPLKQGIIEYLGLLGYQVEDIGVHEDTPVDYPDIAAALAEIVTQKQFDRGILICGTGAGMAIAANKVPGVRAVCVQDPYTAERARASNNAQIITFGSQIIGIEVAKKLLDIWLKSEFQGGRSAPKVQKINDLDQKYRLQRER